LTVYRVNVGFFTEELGLNILVILVVNYVLLRSGMLCLSEANLVVVTVKHGVVELHEVVSANEKVVKAFLSHIQSTNTVAALVAYTLI